MKINKCLRKTILYRLLAISTSVPIAWIIYGDILKAFEVTFFIEVILHSLIYYGVEKREEKHESHT